MTELNINPQTTIDIIRLKELATVYENGLIICKFKVPHKIYTYIQNRLDDKLPLIYRSAKNIHFAIRYLKLNIYKQKELEDYILGCSSSREIINGGFGFSYKGLRNFVGYIGTERFDVNIYFVKMLLNI